VPARNQISLGILAGGQGQRLGGADKATLHLHGVDLLSRTLAAAGPGFLETLLSYNGSDARAARPGLSWVPDIRPGHPGPLAGLESLLAKARGTWLLTLPVDLREATPDLLQQLCDSPKGRAFIRDADGLQPLVAIWPVADTLRLVSNALDAGNRAVHPLLKQLDMLELDISPACLGNLNTPHDFE
jgi:molybdopterin-guanine dinucleotide biosynthesis protein A